MKKVYQIPTMEITILQTAKMMWDLENSNSHVDFMPAFKRPQIPSHKDSVPVF